jgi:hypothetical protein
MLPFKIYDTKDFSFYQNIISKLKAINLVLTETSNLPLNWTLFKQTITGSSLNAGLGQSVSLSSDGTIFAVSAADSNANTGYTSIYKLGITEWEFIGEINGESAGDRSGHSLSLSSDGTILAIGDTGTNNNTGRVRIYQYIGTLWTSIGEIEGKVTGDQLGWSVSLSSDGTVLAIGAIGTINNNTGRVSIYKYNGTTWTSRGELFGEDNFDGFGYSVNLSSDGTVLAIGATNHDNYRGHVSIYEYDTIWTRIGEIDGESTSDLSGWSVSLSSDGTVLAIGATRNDGTGNSAGHVRIYQYIGTTWTPRGEIDGEADGDLSGWSVSLSSDGTVLAIGSPYNNGDRRIRTGQVRVYRYESENWKIIGDIKTISNNSLFGISVSLSSDGTRVAIGATGGSLDLIGSGFVTVYNYTPV